MLSRLNPKTGSRSLLKCIGQFQVPAAACTSVAKQNQSGQRDLINFPRPTRLENTPETRFGFVPKSWFDFLYPKTGVTGPYMLMTGMGVYLFSKEIIVVTPEFPLVVTAITVATLIQTQFGDKIKAFASKLQEDQIQELNNAQLQEKQQVKEVIEANKKEVWHFEGLVQYVPETKRENVQLQMEAAYRGRMQEAFSKIKRYLDYQVEKQNVERRIAQRNMVDYIMRNVEASISPQLKSNALKQCISDLKTLSAKA